MLNFHFEIKSDKKFNGGRNSAARHEKYILREDEYRSDTQIKNKEQKYRDCLTGKNPAVNLPDKERLIYESPFGNIKQDENGIYISQGASVETVAIALSVAEKIYGQEISVRGSDLFREKNIKAASELNLPLKFLHRTLEKNAEPKRRGLKMTDENLKTEAEDMLHQESELESEEVEEAKTKQYKSLVLNSVPSEILPEEDCACLNCPNGIWIATQSGVECFCLVTRSVTSETNSEHYPIGCDGIMLQQENG